MNFFKIKSVLFLSIIQITCSLSCTQSAAVPDQITKKPVKTVLFDLGGVLFETSHSGMGGEIGYADCVMYTLFGFKNPANLKNIAFRLLDTITKPQVAPAGSDLAMADGIVMPGLMGKWMCGVATGPEIITLVTDKIDSGEYDKIFSGSTEKRLVKKVVGALFNPATLAKHTHPIKKGVELVAACAEREDLTLMILSNYAADAFEQLYNKKESEKVFRYFAPEKIIVSGFIGTMKPYCSMYEYLKKEYHIDPATCVIIDDQRENIQAAKAAGFETIFIHKGNFAAARKKLVKLGVLDR